MQFQYQNLVSQGDLWFVHMLVPDIAEISASRKFPPLCDVSADECNMTSMSALCHAVFLLASAAGSSGHPASQRACRHTRHICV
jgi:hypothetical protein